MVKNNPPTLTGGVRPVPLQHLLTHYRDRLTNISPEKRQWRAQFLKDQVLSPNEPRYVPEYWDHRVNIYKRIYRFPLDKLYQVMTPIIGRERAYLFRMGLGKVLMTLYLTYGIVYYYKYNSHDWEKAGSWSVAVSRPEILPGDPGYTKEFDKSIIPELYDYGFKDSPI